MEASWKWLSSWLLFSMKDSIGCIENDTTSSELPHSFKIFYLIKFNAELSFLNFSQMTPSDSEFNKSTHFPELSLLKYSISRIMAQKKISFSSFACFLRLTDHCQSILGDLFPRSQKTCNKFSSTLSFIHFFKSHWTVNRTSRHGKLHIQKELWLMEKNWKL